MHTNKHRNVSIVFRPQDVSKHCAGVEALLVPSIPNHRILFTASRDSTVKRWDVSGPDPALEASFEGHADWVNDMALIGDLLVTCSNDQTVRLWRAGSENGHLLHTLAAHSDYVTRLAAAPDCRLVVSAGLRGEVFSYDVEGGLHTRFQLRSQSSSGEGEGEAATQEEPCSVYALALSPSARLLAAGTSESLVRLLDPRIGRSVWKLRGHKDVVRALAINSCGTKLLSGASDGAIKLWDVGMGRCIQTFQVHTDSVWSLAAPHDSLAYVYSAGRDRALFRTNTHTCASELLAVEDAPVRALAVEEEAYPNPEGGFLSARVGLWAATSASHVNLWLPPAPGKHKLLGVSSLPSPRFTNPTDEVIAVMGSSANSCISAGHCSPAANGDDVTSCSSGGGGGGGAAAEDADPGTPDDMTAAATSTTPGLLLGGRSLPVLRVSHAASMGRAKEPLVQKPVATVPGIPAIVAHEVLADQRRILTRDARGNVALWDVLLGTEMVLYGKADFNARSRELWEPRHVPPWFTCDHRLGCLSITLNPDSAFTAEDYAVNVGFGDVPEDRKINYGKLVLECVFAKWRFALIQNLNCCVISPGGSSCSDGLYGMRMRQSTNGGTCNGGARAAIAMMLHGRRSRSHSNGYEGSGGSGEGSDSHCCGGDDDDDRVPVYYKALWPKYWHIGTVPAVICSRSDGQRWRRLLTSFDGSETEPDEVPSWIANVILRSASVSALVSKVTFYLLPVKGSNLPTLPITRLQAPHIFEVHKVAKYCSDKLQEHGIQLEVLAGHRQRIPLCTRRVPDPGSPGSQPPSLPYRALELTCNGLAVPYDMNLAAVKKFLWHDSDDLTFLYGVRDPHNPAPQPRLGPRA